MLVLPVEPNLAIAVVQNEDALVDQPVDGPQSSLVADAARAIASDHEGKMITCYPGLVVTEANGVNLGAFDLGSHQQSRRGIR